MTYNELMEEAKEVYYRVAQNSPFCAQFEAREYIASKIDMCSDRNEHLNVLEWDEYKKNYMPVSRAEYNSRKEYAKKVYEDTLAQIEQDWEERGKNSPDYHKI